MRLLLITTGIFLATTEPAWLHDITTAKEKARKEHKFILLNFSGSDWCLPCIRLHKELFDTEAFTGFANENLVLVNADFPRKNKNQPTKEQQKINDAMAERYDPNGNFPYTLLLDADGNKVKVWDGFYKNGVESFIEEIKNAEATAR